MHHVSASATCPLGAYSRALLGQQCKAAHIALPLCMLEMKLASSQSLILCAPLSSPCFAVFGSQYDEEGLLTAELASFVELRMLQPASGQRNKQTTPAQPAPAAAAAATTVQKAAVAAPEPAARLAAAPVTTTNGGNTAGEGLGPSSYSQLGPPRPASRGDVIAAEGGWASLYEQLRQRRAQLVGQSGEAAQQQGAATAEAGTPKALPQQPSGSAAKAVRSAPPAAGREHINSNRATATSGGRGPGSLTPGATRPRAGVRRTALGPMLRMLRASQELS